MVKDIVDQVNDVQSFCKVGIGIGSSEKEIIFWLNQLNIENRVVNSKMNTYNCSKYIESN